MKEGWEEKKLGELCDLFADGDWIESKDQSVDGIRLIQTGNVGGGIFKDRSEKARYISETTFDRLRCTEIFNGDCLISRLPDPVGRSCILPQTGKRMITAVDCTIVRFDSTRILPQFFNYYSQSNKYLGAVAKECTGTTRNRISRGNLASIPIPVPLLPEQERIVALLDEAFAAIAIAEDNAEKNLQNARALFDSALSAIAPQSEQASWSRTTVAALAASKKGSIRTGPFGSQLLHSEFVEEGIAVLGIDNAVANEFRWGKSRFITAEKYRSLERYRIQPGDVLITIMGTCGRCAIVPEGIPLAINTKHLCCITLDRSRCLPGYLHAYFLHHSLAKEFLAKHSKGAIMAGLNMGLIQELPVMLPPIKRQKEIVDALDLLKEETRDLADLYQRKLAALDELKKSLLHQAFTGQLTPQEVSHDVTVAARLIPASTGKRKRVAEKSASC